MAKGDGFSIGGWLLQALTENVGLKLFSLLIAIILFSLVRGSEGAEGAGESQRTFFVDVLHRVPQGDSQQILVSDVPPRVRVTLQGSRYLLASVDREDLQTDIDLSDPSETFYFFEASDFKGVPAGVTVIDIDPPSLALKWDNRIKRNLPVRLRLEGPPAPGLEVVQPIQMVQKTVRVIGAQRSFPSEVATEPLDVGTLEAGTHERTLRLEPLPAHVRYDNVSQVQVAVELRPEVRERVLRGLVVSAVGPPAIVRPRVVQVTLRGPPAEVDMISEENLVPWVDATDGSLEGTVAAQVQVRGVPEGVTVASVEPREVFLTIQRR